MQVMPWRVQLRKVNEILLTLWTIFDLPDSGVRGDAE